MRIPICSAASIIVVPASTSMGTSSISREIFVFLGMWSPEAGYNQETADASKNGMIGGFETAKTAYKRLSHLGFKRTYRSQPVKQVDLASATACVLWVHLGNPSEYHCAEAYRKAMGLNLTVGGCFLGRGFSAASCAQDQVQQRGEEADEKSLMEIRRSGLSGHLPHVPCAELGMPPEVSRDQDSHPG